MLHPSHDQPHPNHYNPAQPRVLKGHDGAGRWTREGYGFTQLAFAGPPPAGPGLLNGLVGALGLFTELSARNNRDSQAVIAFKAEEYRATADKVLDLEGVAQLDRNRVERVCKRLEQVQKLADAAAVAVNMDKRISRATEYGTAVHFRVKQAIEALDDYNFRAEVSYQKMRDEGIYGWPGSIRIDVLEKAARRTVCVHDLKTGPTGLTPARFREIAQNVYAAYPDTLRIIITEVHPSVRRLLNGAYR
jgi:hypothetical protein